MVCLNFYKTYFILFVQIRVKQRLTKLEGGPPGLNISLPGPSTSGTGAESDTMETLQLENEL